jgi:chromosome segregation ATPase
MEGVPDLTRSSGKHTEEHHLIRCLAPPEEAEKAPLVEQRLASLEEQLGNMQNRFVSLEEQVGNMHKRFVSLEEQVGNMHKRFDDFSSRIEELLNRVASNIG